MCEDLYLIARVQHLAHWNYFSVNSPTYARVANARVDVVGEIKYGCAFGEFVQISFRGEGIDLVLVEIELELVHYLQVVACL